MDRAILRRRDRSGANGIPGYVRAGILRAISPTTDTGFKEYGSGRLFLPAATNLIPDPQGVLANGTFWPATTAHTAITGNVTPPVALPAELTAAGITKCLSMVNDGTADTPETAVLTVTVNLAYQQALYIYAPSVTGAVTITTQATGASTVATLSAANAGFIRYNALHTAGAAETTLHLHFAFATGGATVYVTGAGLVRESALAPFFCGLTHECAWTGAANASTSTRTASALVYAPPDISVAGFVAARCVSLYPSTNSDTQPICTLRKPTTNYVARLRFAPATWSMQLYDGTNVSASVSSPQTFLAGTPHSLTARWQTKVDLMADGVAVIQANNTTTLAQAPTLLEVGTDGFSTLASSQYIGPVAICPARITDAETVQLDAMLTAGATGCDLVRFLRSGGYMNSLVIPLQGDSTAYKVVA